jgi:serine/threonine-protein kinase
MPVTEIGIPAIAYPSRHGTITGQAAELPATQREPGRSAMWPVFAALGGLAIVVTVLITTGVIPLGAGDEDEDASGPLIAVGSASASASETPADPVSPLEAVAGQWVSESGRRLEAVVVGDRIEFEVVEPSEFAPQPYGNREARFVLHPLPEEGKYLVEDRIRPVPPAGHAYASANARTTCVGVWREAAGEPLRAQLSGDRLDVDFGKIEPTPANFAIAGKQVVSCRGLESLSATRVPGMFRRP